MALWLWICFAGGIGALLNGDWALGAAALGAGLVTLIYAGTQSPGNRWLIRAGLALLWVLGGLLLWHWAVEDWAVALRVIYVALGGGALVAYLLYGRGGLRNT